jgi:hypothetical protein
MPRVDVSEAAAPATRAAEKLRLLMVIAMPLLSLIGSAVAVIA